MKILFVDENFKNRLTAESFLEHRGHTVIEANSVLQANTFLNHQSSGCVDVVISTLEMNEEVNGFEVLKKAKAKHPAAVLCLLCATNERRIVEEAETKGVIVVPKPIRMRELCEILEL